MRIRGWLVALLVLSAIYRLSAHEDSWLRSNDPENASYFAPKLRVSHLQDSLAFWPGVGIGWIVGSVISVGFEGYMLATDPRGPNASGRLSMALGGMSFEATPFPERRTHMSFNVLVGAGGSQTEGEVGLDSLSNHTFFFAAPGAKLEFNLTPNIRLCPGISYLWSPDPVWGLPGNGLQEPMLTFDLLLKKRDPD
ncbi:MAG: hypothetical protein JF616_18390 [Fibrobacteres bacterium]|jgi:hypothetical protein|nr:hypothetical protein [Fibrobacterota bacterium]